MAKKELKNKKPKYLFVIDLDGTTLSDSAISTIHPETIEGVKLAQEQGHIVCIITGRPWRSSKKAYEELGLKTVIGNYNGAHIHNPSDEFFIPKIAYLNLNEMLYILGDKHLKKYINNIAIEGPGWVQLQHSDPLLEKIFGFDEIEKKSIGLNFAKIPLQPTGVVFDIKEGVDSYELKKYLERRYGDLGEFSSWSKGDGLPPVFDITSLGISKGKTLPLLMRYYDIEMDHTITFGDGFNDVSMFQVSNVAVAMKNSDKRVQKYATVVLRKSNKEGGVGYYIKQFLKNPEKHIKNSKKLRLQRAKDLAPEIT
ncbi:Cof-type HAD-IIB family hydrolase [Mycoplasma iguanae]|uniref:Cof-type HAD-IIB family hydrolase n=1 Tax=Mycoplasma iguanae TaxID=292461 RepID=A0ABY5RCI2_9MOLU|nr:Cof-type HAD-IIB family hydrolase [Mycoplasma iguanae]UVD81925.1 Cof-type HAD-IIB family hydrolase [Mycoplasma iguanae]